MIQLTGSVVVERKGTISSRLQVVPTDPAARIALLIDRAEVPTGVLQNPHRACARPVQHQMIQPAAAIVIKGKSSIGGRSQVVPTNPATPTTLFIDRDEDPTRFS